MYHDFLDVIFTSTQSANQCFFRKAKNFDHSIQSWHKFGINLEEVMLSVPCVCLYVCVFVHTLAAEPLDLTLSIHIHLHDISDRFEGQGRRSKVKVTDVK